MLLTVLIPNYNGRDLLEKNLPSVYSAIKYAGVSSEIIIVDDASQDDSIAYLQKYHPRIKVLSNAHNLGFSKTCNKGIKEAKGKLLLLLNSDVKLDLSYISKCVKEFISHDNPFAVFGRIIDDYGASIKNGILYKKCLFKIKKKINAKNGITHFVSGANAVFCLDKLRKIGGFDTIYSPYYFEDDDLSYRAYKKGWDSFFIGDAVCYHQGAATIKKSVKKSKLKQVYFSNKFIFHYKHTDVSPILFDIKTILIDVFPKLIVGKTWVWKSYRRYKERTRNVVRNSIPTSLQTLSADAH